MEGNNQKRSKKEKKNDTREVRERKTSKGSYSFQPPYRCTKSLSHRGVLDEERCSNKLRFNFVTYLLPSRPQSGRLKVDVWFRGLYTNSGDGKPKYLFWDRTDGGPNLPLSLLIYTILLKRLIVG